MTSFRVYVVAPRREKDGTKWQLLAKAPRASGARPKRKTSGTSDRAEAEEVARAWEADLNGHHAPVGADASVAAVLDKHLAAREGDGTAPGTLTTYRTAFKRVHDLLSLVRADQLDGPALARLRDALLARPLDGKTVNVTLSRVRSAWRWALELGHVKAPWPDVKAAPAKRTKKRPMRPTELAAFLRWAGSYAGGRWLPFFSLAADTGARSGDLLALNGRDVDRERRRVWVRGSKTDAPHWAGVTARTLALLPTVGADEPLFAGQRGRLKTNAPLVALRVGVKAIGIEDGDRLDVHSLRRTNVKEADRTGVSLGMAMRQTGHENPTVHLRYQRDHDDEEDMAAVADQIASRWTPHLDPAPDPLPVPTQEPAAPDSQWLVTNSLEFSSAHSTSARSCDCSSDERAPPRRA